MFEIVIGVGAAAFGLLCVIAAAVIDGHRERSEESYYAPLRADGEGEL